MASIAFANVAAAVAAGYKEIVVDRGPQVQAPGNRQVPLPRFFVRFEKPLAGESGQSGSLYEASGEGATQVAAETVALSNLNFKRGHRYGTDSAGHNTDVRGGALTLDTN